MDDRFDEYASGAAHTNSKASAQDARGIIELLRQLFEAFQSQGYPFGVEQLDRVTVSNTARAPTLSYS
ncbi:hypothetical protein PFUM301598_17110 [Pseudomonas fluorescens]